MLQTWGKLLSCQALGRLPAKAGDSDSSLQGGTESWRLPHALGGAARSQTSLPYGHPRDWAMLPRTIIWVELSSRVWHVLSQSAHPHCAPYPQTCGWDNAISGLWTSSQLFFHEVLDLGWGRTDLDFCRNVCSPSFRLFLLGCPQSNPGRRLMDPWPRANEWPTIHSKVRWWSNIGRDC